jgi:NAD(P)-dependent dehydrogenase (short-subunit alcohol dehydrogenase family)
MRIDGQAALVAGGASGLGEASVRQLHGAGAQVVIADVNEDKGRALAEELGERATFAKTDVTDEAEVQAAVAAAAELDGGLRISVCCAGVGWPEKIAGKHGPHQRLPST